ncbi:MAG: hypothetical protein LBI08_03780 [Methanomassiliicoccaceae archaeon]|jgi:hypothetical protein|nr:hypothetical protein [Methanomassiliicoccaceae archaeon]
MFVREKDVIWEVRPFLYVLDAFDVTLNKENLEYRWVSPEEMEMMNTVPGTVSAVKELLSKVIP